MSATRSFPVVSLGVAVCTVWLILSGVLIAPCRAQTIIITDTRDTTQNLDVLYPGSGDRTALLTASAVVDVPGGSGDGLYSATGAPWTITNIGAIRGDNGVYLGLGGSVTNLDEITGRDLNGIGIYMASTGGICAVTNGSDGTITAGSSFAIGGIGINMQNSLPTSTVDNFGNIYAYGDGVSSRGTGVLLNGGGTLNNRPDAVIIGGYGDTTGIGAYLYGPGTVNNSGSITGNNAQGVIIVGTGTVNNVGTGTITGNGATIGVWISGGTGTVTNEEAATITGGRNGVVISGSGSVTNDGTIVGQDDGYYGVRFSNTTAGTYTTAVTNGGSITGGAAGVSVRFVPATGTVTATNVIDNTGTIAATGTDGAGLWIQGAEGTFTNTISNDGTISGVYGVLLEPDTATFTNTITNTGTIEGTTEAGLDITGLADVVNSGTITGATGIVFDDTTSDSLDNTGSITGTDGTAVDMGGGDDAVELGTGTAITGIVDGGDGTDTMTFSGTGGIGIAQVTNFEAFSKEDDGIWTLTGTGSLGADIAVNGGMLAVAGTLSDDVTVGSLGGLMGSGTVVGSVTNSGRVAPGNSIGTLTID
ncbi:MAG: hypothetical protein KQI62_21480, partial [Deltaproteobacteria bacterium]|nr:hypothetical protein [Deltaproteobacteria bacterium]